MANMKHLPAILEISSRSFGWPAKTITRMQPLKLYFRMNHLSVFSAFGHALTVDVAPVGQADDFYNPFLVVYGVDNSVITNSHAPGIEVVYQLFRSCRSGRASQLLEHWKHPRQDLSRKSANFFTCRGGQLYLITKLRHKGY